MISRQSNAIGIHVSCWLIAMACWFGGGPIVLPVLGQATPGPSPARIMLLGDDLTQSDSRNPGYRYWLWKRLDEAGYRVDYVGSQKDYHQGPAPVKDKNFDTDHEGHWGLSSGQLLEKLNAWAAAAKPQYVLIYIGGHDLDDPAAAAANVGKMIDICRNHHQRVTVLLAQIAPILGQEDKVKTLNQALAKLSSKSTERSLVVLVDHGAQFDAKALLQDGIHPNQNGAKWIADRWFQTLAPLLDRLYPLLGRKVDGNLSPLNRFLRIGDYGGISAEIDEYTAGGRLNAADLDQAAVLLDDIAAYSRSQQDRADRLANARRHYDAATILQTLARQFKGTPVSHQALDRLASWQRDSRLGKELAAGPMMYRAREAHRLMRYAQAGQLYADLVRQHPGTAAATEAQRQINDLKARDLLVP